jgi:hypothetical protein
MGSKDYQIDLYEGADETGTVGLWDMSGDLINMIISITESNNRDTVQQAVYDTLKELRKNSMALGIHEFNTITPTKAQEWLDIYESIKENFNSQNMPANLTNQEKSDFVLDMLRNMGFRADAEYDEQKNPHYDFEVWYNDNSYGLRLFFGLTDDNKLRLYDEFYGYMYGDDNIYEDLTVPMLMDKLD